MNAVQCIHVRIPSCKVYPNILLCHSLHITVSRNLIDPLRISMHGWNSKMNLATFIQEKKIGDFLLCTVNQFNVDILHLSKLLVKDVPMPQCNFSLSHARESLWRGSEKILF